MFYKPTYCCNCGEKIERADASFLGSGRFCDVCKHDFVLQRAAPKIFVALMAVFGLFGIGSYWRSGEKPLNVSARQFAVNSTAPGRISANNAAQVSSNSSVQQAAQTNTGLERNAPDVTTKPPVKQSVSPAVKTEEAVYICGAPTKKGTPCSRRVRGGGRCWQHRGQNAMLPPEKLTASR